MKMARFISFEGLNGAGKSSHIQWFAELLVSKGETVVCTREPGGTPAGERLRSLLLESPLDRDAQLLLMFACRRQLLSEVIEPALASGKIVVSDRFADSSYAFQGGGGQIHEERIRVLDAWCGGPRPDLTFYFDVPVAVATARVMSRQGLDHFEREAQAYQERVREVFLDRAARDPERIRVVDATRSIGAIRSDLQAMIECGTPLGVEPTGFRGGEGS